MPIDKKKYAHLFIPKEKPRLILRPTLTGPFEQPPMELSLLQNIKKGSKKK